MENKNFAIEDPFNFEINLKRSGGELNKSDLQINENKKKRIPSLNELPESLGWEIIVYNEALEKNQTFHVSEQVGKRFKYFRVLGEKILMHCENSLKNNSLNNEDVCMKITFETAKIVFQNNTTNNGLFRKLNQHNFVTILFTLDYLGFLPMVGNEQETNFLKDEEFDVELFWSSLARKLSCFDWFSSETSIASIDLRRKVLQLSLKIQNGFRLLYELMQYQFMRDVILSFEGGSIIREIFKYRSEIYGIKIVNAICDSVGAQWSPDISSVEDFLKGITDENDIFDAISFVWQPTLWYLSERKSIPQFAQNSPHVISGDFGNFPIELELYADQDYEGSSTTVNFAMETPPPNPDASITSITSLGIFAYPKTRCTGFFSCFSARAKFFFGKIFLGEATFDLTSDGIKAFCPVISGGPNKTGLLVTCRIDEFIERNKEELLSILSENQVDICSSESLRILQSSNFNATIDQITVSDLTVDVKIRFFPLRTLSLYLLYRRSLGTDTKFITNFAFSLQQDVAEWLGTYFTCVWIQISKQRDSLFSDKKSSVIPLSAKSLKNQKNFLSDSHKLSEINTPNHSTRYSSSNSSDSRDVLAFLENERFGNDNIPASEQRLHSRNGMRFEFINDFDSSETIFKDIASASSQADSFSSNSPGLRYNSSSSTCYIDPVSPRISPFPLISSWFKGVGKPGDTWCIHNILSEVLSDDLIAKHFTDVLAMIQTCESWVDAESLTNIRQHFIHFMNNNKLDSIGALLFDWIRHMSKSKGLELKD